MSYALHVHSVNVDEHRKSIARTYWQSILVPRQVKLATDQRNPLKRYY
jgi:hypothetical protein